MDLSILIVLFTLFIIALMGVKIVPQQQAWIVERLGKYNKTLEPGLTIILPFIDKVSYKHSLKERAIDVHEQVAITQDNVTVVLDGVVYVRVINPVDASYGVENPYYAVIQLAQTSMRSAIGKMPMDKTFEERETLNIQIVHTINEAATTWGVQCMRYEIKNITPPENVIKAMEMQVAAERQKRADILESEGKKQAQINMAEAQKQSVVLASEANMQEQINKAIGEGKAILTVAEASATGIMKIAAAMQAECGKEAVSMKVAEQYISAFSSLAKESNTVVIPANTSDASGMVAQALTIFDKLKKTSV